MPTTKRMTQPLHPHGPQIPGTIHGRLSPQRLPTVAPNQNNVVIYSQRSKTTENTRQLSIVPFRKRILEDGDHDLRRLPPTDGGPLRSPQPFLSSGGVDGSCGPGGRSPTRLALTLLQRGVCV